MIAGIIQAIVAIIPLLDVINGKIDAVGVHRFINGIRAGFLTIV